MRISKFKVITWKNEHMLKKNTTYHLYCFCKRDTKFFENICMAI